MILQLGPEGVFIAHFSHSVKRRESLCGIHGGFCVKAGKDQPCTVPALHGRARASRADQFSRAVGRKLAFTRAIEPLPKDLRTMLWDAYWRQVRAPWANSAARANGAT
jgi:hypothetical protein